MALLDAKFLPTTVLSKIGDLSLDAVVSETHRYGNTLTQNPVESGAMITDHIINEPITLRMEALVSDAPLGLKSALAAGAAGLASQALGVSGALGAVAAGAAAVGAGALTGASRGSASRDAFKLLVDLWKGRKIITVVTGLQVYKNMAIESLEFPRDTATGRALRIQIALKQVRIATTLFTETSVAADTQHSAPPEANLGRQPTQPWQSFGGP